MKKLAFGPPGRKNREIKKTTWGDTPKPTKNQSPGAKSTKSYKIIQNHRKSASGLLGLPKMPILRCPLISAAEASGTSTSFGSRQYPGEARAVIAALCLVPKRESGYPPGIPRKTGFYSKSTQMRRKKQPLSEMTKT